MNEHSKRKAKRRNTKSCHYEPPHSRSRLSESPSTIVTLLTDFGLTDAYVGTMKGVVASISPHASIIDLCHHIAPQDIFGAAFLLASSFSYFPRGMVHLAVVDPTVGSERRAICARSGGHYFIGPDNGVLSIACYRAGRPRIYCLENEEYFLPQRSHTFHGRDFFAPAAAHLAAGAPIETMGPRARSMKRIKIPRPTARSGTVVSGRVIYVDRFGNLITNVGPDDITRTFPKTGPEKLVITCGDHPIRGLSETYSDVPPDTPVALFGSYDLMEIAVRDGSASSRLGIERGDRVSIEKAPQSTRGFPDRGR